MNQAASPLSGPRRAALKRLAAPALSLGFGAGPALALPAAAGGGAAGPLGVEGLQGFDSVLLDPSHPLAHRLSQGQPPLRFDGDVTELWFNMLDLRTRAAPLSLVGLTGASAALCLQHLLAGRRMVLALRIGHEALAGGGVCHHIEAPASAVPALSAALADRSGGALAQACQLAVHAAGPLVAAQVCTSGAQVHAAAPTRWMTWALRPVRPV